jgi:hypothetical protein
MKYGIVMHTETANLGDDVQTYAATKLLPQVDYIIDREHLDSFESENDEPVATIMAAWWFWQKWNWPPSPSIVPLLTSMHINNYDIYNRGTPVKDHWLDGLGREYLDAYGPVGVRDESSLEFFKERGIDTYFSGCITLTLPKQKTTDDAGQYVCLVDLNETLKAKAMQLLENTGLRVVEVSHRCHYRGTEATLEERMSKVEETLTLYQNAKCVITRRLHVSLPCLAMEVPVLSVVDLKEPGNYTRWAPYSEWLHYVSNEDFKAGNFEYDFTNPPANKDTYKPYRESLINRVNEFIEETKDYEGIGWRKTTYTQQDVLVWQNKLMKETLENWLHDSRGMMIKYNKSKAKIKELENSINLKNVIIRFLRKVKHKFIKKEKKNSEEKQG